MAKITANNIQAGSITLDRFAPSVVTSISSASESGSKAQDAFDAANTGTLLAQAAFEAANNASGGGGGASGGIINLNMPGILNVPFTGTSRYYPTKTITLGTVYANLGGSPTSNLQFVLLKNGANIGNSFIITTSSPVMTPVVTSGVSLTTSDYLSLNLLGNNVIASDLLIKITYS